MVNCAKCGEVISEGKNFCANCGEKVIEAQVPKGMDYEDYKMEKSRYIGSTLFYFGAILLSLGLALTFFLTFDVDTSYGQETGFVEVPAVTILSKILIIAGTIAVFIGASWAIDVGWYINKRRSEQFWATHKK